MVLFNSEINRVHIFPQGISPKVNVIALLEIELVYDNVRVCTIANTRFWTSTATNNETKLA